MDSERGAASEAVLGRPSRLGKRAVGHKNTSADQAILEEGNVAMIHYSCDLCGARLDGLDQRYVVKIEVYAAADEREVSGPDDIGELGAELEDLTESLARSDADHVDDANYRGFRFDLCPRCQRRYLADPLFRAAKKRLGYSEN